jgi:hypothetical protein
LRNACPGILLVLIVVAAAALSGCTSGPASPTVATGAPNVVSPAPAPVTLRSGSLFDTGKLQWFEYRLTGSDKPAVSDVRFDYLTTVINGISVRDDRITMKIAAPEMTVIMDKYYDPASNAQVGTHTKTVSSGTSLSDLGLQASDLYRDNNVAEAFTAGNWPMKSPGTDAVTIDGKTYQCTKYSVGDSGEHGTAWVSGEVPVPVKIEQKFADGDTSTWELIGRG